MIKAQIRIKSQTILAHPEHLPIDKVQLKVYGSVIVNLPEPFGFRDFDAKLLAWIHTYGKHLRDDPSAVLEITPLVNVPELPIF